MADINTEEVFKKLKKQHGETFAKIMRGDEDHNGDLCAIPNILHILEFAGRNPDEARQLRKVIQEIYLSKERSVSRTTKNPLQLLSDAGYEAFVVKTEQQKNSIIGYYRSNERLCTFGDPERHINYYMIHAIKKEVLGDDKLPQKKWHIQPSDKPERQDEYGTSVISIQIAKSGGFISIKNRYNHTIANPDATFGNNPDNIIPGLSDALKKYFHVEFNTTKRSQLPDNFRMVNDQLVRFNYETNNIYFGPDYYFSGSTITKLKDNGSQLLFYHGFMLDISHDNSQIISIAGVDPKMCDAMNKYIRGKKIKVTGAKGGTKTVLLDGERFMDITDGMITFVNMSAWHTVRFDSARGIRLSGDLDFSNVKYLALGNLDLHNVTSMKFNPNAEAITLNRTIKLSGNLDFSNVKYLDLRDLDLHNVTGIKFNPNADTIMLDKTIKLSGNLDFSGVKKLDLNEAGLTNVTDIKFNPNAQKINLNNTKLFGDLDFSGVSMLDLSDADLSKVTSIKFNPNAQQIDLKETKLFGDLDFSNVYDIDLRGADLSEITNIKLPSGDGTFRDFTRAKLSGFWDFSIYGRISLERADLTQVTGIKFPDPENIFLRGAKLGGKWDFSNAKKLDLTYADLTQVTEIIFPDKEFVNLKGAVLAGDWDFSDIEVVRLSEADLTSVTSIKFNPNAMFMGDIDDHDYPCRVFLNDADLRNANLNPIFNLKDGYVNLSWTKLSGDLDFSDVAELKLHNADFTNVKSIKLSWPIYKQIKGQKCKIHGIDVAIADLPRHRIKIIKQNPFIVAKKKLQENLFSKITRKLEQKKLVKSIGRDGRKPQ